MKPKVLYQLASFLYPLSLTLGLLLFALSSVYILNIQDVDYQQGEIFKLIYIHVPSSWWALGMYGIMALSSALGFITKIPQYHLITKFWSIPGFIFTLLSLITGMIWGHFTWGTFWVWDARLTTMFIQLMLYIGYLMVVLQSNKHQEKNYVIGSFIVLLGAINLPLIKWSVDWWFTLHQGSSISFFKKSTVHPTFIWPLFTNVVSFFFMGFSLFLYQVRNYFKKRS
jgi:heme exporter protein C